MFDVAKSGVQFGVFVQVAKWCNFPHNAFWLFCLHLALFTCTLPALSLALAYTGGYTCLHWVSHLSALATGVVCHGRACAGIGGQARRLLLSVFRAPYTDMSGWRDCDAACMAQVFCSAGCV